MSNNKNLLFSITRKDLDIILYAAHSGPGGQNQNKRASACRITHRPSGAVGDSKTHRQQAQNKKEALRRLVASEKFKTWLRVEVAARLQGYANIEQKMDEIMHPENIKIETFKGNKWQSEKD
jgi:hypothetical protein